MPGSHQLKATNWHGTYTIMINHTHCNSSAVQRAINLGQKDRQFLVAFGNEASVNGCLWCARVTCVIDVQCVLYVHAFLIAGYAVSDGQKDKEGEEKPRSDFLQLMSDKNQ